MKKNKKIAYIFFIILLISIDQCIKIILMKTTDLKNQLYLNSNNNYYIIASIIIIILIIRYISNDNIFIKKPSKIILGFGIAGAFGNLIDRIYFGGTINYIGINSGFRINLSYIYVMVAWVGIALILSKNTMDFLQKKNKKI